MNPLTILGRQIGIAGSVLYAGASTGSFHYACWRLNNEDDELTELGKLRVSLNIPHYKEPPETLEQSLESLRNQNIVHSYPSNFEYISVGVKSDPSLDEGILRRHVDRVLLTEKRGKLSGRDYAIRESKGDFIVSVDADTFYPPNFLNLMLRPYLVSDEVVATTGTTRHDTPLEPFTHLSSLAYFGNRILGRASTFYRRAYFDTGGFDLSLEKNGYTPDMFGIIYDEEESAFRKRLGRLGRIVMVDAPVRHLYNFFPFTINNMRGLHSEYDRGRRAI